MRTKGLVMPLLAAALLLTIGTLWAQSRVPTISLTRTQRIELVDRGGKIRAELKASDEETLLVLYDGQGRLRTVIGTESVAFYGVDGKLRGKIDARNLQEAVQENR
ncbi:MAG: hypothetical protein KatS3mg022_3358 [Armatimonadota bacterium]|nr:MAG: hypothetical protein KatS3mg022_3358 [Armatimonadota bacterium]